MLTAIEDIDVVIPVHADTADFPKRPTGREFRPVLHWFVCVFAIAHGSHGQDPCLFHFAELVTKRGGSASDSTGQSSRRERASSFGLWVEWLETSKRDYKTSRRIPPVYSAFAPE